MPCSAIHSVYRLGPLIDSISSICGTLSDSATHAVTTSAENPSGEPRSSVVTWSPSAASSRAAIIPSPPLLPPPQSTVTRRARGNRSCANAATSSAARCTLNTASARE